MKITKMKNQEPRTKKTKTDRRKQPRWRECTDEIKNKFRVHSEDGPKLNK